MGGQAVGSQAPTLEFAGDRIAGSGGCNRYFGAYTMSAETLSINGVGSTEMACDGPVMQREAAYFQALQATRAYRRLGDTLILSDADGGTITLRPN